MNAMMTAVRKCRSLGCALLLGAATTGCVPFGIAGAGFDSRAVQLEAHQFRTFIGPGVSVIHQSKSYGPNSLQQLGCMLAEFERFRTVAQHSSGRMDDLDCRFADHRILIREGEAVLVDRSLPRAFYMHGLEWGIDEVSGRRIMVVTNATRGTTGLNFIGIYEMNGTPLYEAVISRGAAWDIQKSEKGILILGAVTKREIVVPGR